MADFAKKLILHSKTAYVVQHDQLLLDIIDAKVLLFCAVGKDCELFHDVMDELMVGDGAIERDFFMITTWHTDETLEDVIHFAKFFHIDDLEDDTVQVIEI